MHITGLVYDYDFRFGRFIFRLQNISPVGEKVFLFTCNHEYRCRPAKVGQIPRPRLSGGLKVEDYCCAVDRHLIRYMEFDQDHSNTF